MRPLLGPADEEVTYHNGHQLVDQIGQFDSLRDSLPDSRVRV